MSGLFISFEGIDGCGKTTQLQLLEAWLQQHNLPVVCTREPGGTHIGTQIRNILLNPEHQNLCSDAELLLYLADRIQHLHEVILPEKSQGKIVLCDRFHDSSIAYQGYGRGLDLSLIHSITQEKITPYAPDLTVLLDLPSSLAMKRTQQRPFNASESSFKQDRIDAESSEFFDRVNQGFHKLSSTNPERFLVLDATESREQLHQTLIMNLKKQILLPFFHEQTKT